MPPSDNAPAQPKAVWAERFAGILAGSFAIPLLGEILLAVLNNEDFDYLRTAITAMVLGVGAAILYASQVGRIVFQRARAGFLIVAGFATATQGFLQAARPEWLRGDPIEGVVGMVTLILGLSVFAMGWFYFRVEAPVAEAAAIPAPREPLPIETVSFVRAQGRYDAAKHTKYFDACRAALSLEQLHYVAYYEGRQQVFAIDVFDRLEDFQPVETTQAQRREKYHEHGPQIIDLMAELDGRFSALETGPLIRMVFDVEQGAIYYHMINSNPAVHVIGVTLDQAQIHTADDALEKLSAELRRRSGRLPITQQNT
ncbi:hypothetical protein ACFQO7_18855 [Catellatospora aurea]|uniref:Uncharacterized protein n=1 Tax=Catellatospora aurea TaxID=1337874 RepID=A0ABW2GY62_9ACTN